MASKTAGAAEKMNGGSGKMEDMAVKTDEVARKWKTIGKEDGGCGKKDGGYGKEDGGCGGEDGGCLRQICANFGGRRDKSCATFAQAGDVQIVSKLTAWNGRKRDDGRGFCLKMLQK